MSAAAGEPPIADAVTQGLSLAPFRALRPAVDSERLALMLCPPYDVIDAATRAALLAADPANAVSIILPDRTAEGYAQAATDLTSRIVNGLYAVEDAAAIYVYEMHDDATGSTTRGLLGAVQLRDPDDGVILPHENTMAGPVADRLEVMTATGTDLEPIYLVYDGGGAASELVRDTGRSAPLAATSTADGLTHRLWRITDPEVHAAVEADLAGRHALIADGHHRYATYRERQRIERESRGPGPWDRGLALLVDSTDYGPQVHAIHRVIPGLTLADALERLGDQGDVVDAGSIENGLQQLDALQGFAVVLTDGSRTVVVTDPGGSLAAAAHRPGDLAALTALDVTVLHRGLVEQVWGLTDDVDTVGYAHSVEEAVAAAETGIAVLLRPTPVQAVAAVAAAGARMPRKSTLFTPKPASGLVMRRLSDQLD